jgi:hypothetical protein
MTLGGQWVPLGIFRFDRPTPAVVDVSNVDGTEASVDAIRFVYEGAEPPILRVETSAVPLATLEEPYSVELEAAGGTPPYRWYAFGDLPRGLSTGGSTLRGAPEEEGSFEFRLQVEDGNGDIAAIDLTLEVLQKGSSSPTLPVARDSTASSNAPGDLSELLSIVEGMGEGEWARVNENFFSEVWTPAHLRPLKGVATNPTPHKIIGAWSSFAWDSRRGDLIIYGGGHANYSGNDVYRWRGSTRRWERASLPSEITQDDRGTWMAVDGVDAAPASAHTYDNNVYLRVSDRFLTYGGAAYSNGSSYFRQVSVSQSRRTGPYLFDPSKANGNKVGGTTGSHVQRVAPFPAIVGGEMWENRDIYGKIPGNPPLPTSFVVGATGYSEEGGKDVIYVSARSGGTAQALYKHTIHDIHDPTRDTWEKVGSYYSGFGDQGSGAYDPVLNVFVRTGGGAFTYWNLSSAGPKNRNVTFSPEAPAGFTLDRHFGMDFDPIRHRFALWRGDGRVWMLEPPPTVSPRGWKIVEQISPTSEVPNGDSGTGILGKWKYIKNLDVFLGLQHSSQGNIWIYKPVGWQRPDLNQPLLLQEGIDGYSGTQDTYLSSGTPFGRFGSSSSLLEKRDRQRMLISFDIFASEGGPVPDGALIHSATMSLYKFSAYNHSYRAHRLLRPWSERFAQWVERDVGVPWTVMGGSADIASAPVAEGSIGWDPQWMELDLTNAVQRIGDGQPNFGWMIVPVQGNANIKRFRSSEEVQEPSQRPKIVVVYSPR